MSLNYDTDETGNQVRDAQSPGAYLPQGSRVKGGVPTPFWLGATMVLVALIIEAYLVYIPSFVSPMSTRLEALLFTMVLASVVYTVFYFILVQPLATHASYHKEVEATLRKSEERYKHIVDSMSDVYWEIGTDCSFTTMSSSIEKVFGYKVEEIIGKTPFDFMPKEKAEKARNVFIDLMRAREAIKDMEIWMFRKNGNMVCLSVNAAPLLGENGELEGYRGVYRDITDRKSAEEALKISETKYRIIADNNYDWEFWLSPQGHFLYSSPSCKRITGYASSEFESHSALFLRITHPEDQDTLTDRLKRSMNNQKKGSLRFRIINKNGEERLIESYLSPVYDNDNHFLGLRGSNRDITSRGAAEHGLQESERRYREIIENIHLAAVIMDIDGQLFYCNDSFLLKTGYERNEINGCMFFEKFVEPGEAERFQRFLLGDISKGMVPSHFVGHILTKNGEKLAIDWRNVILRNSSGKIIGVTCVGEDVVIERRDMALQQYSREI